MRYQFIQDHRQVWPLKIQCEVLDVSRSGYYAWRRRPPSPRALRRAELTDRIRQIHARPHHANYGAPACIANCWPRACPAIARPSRS